MRNRFFGWRIVLLFYVFSLFLVADSWISNNIGEPKEIISIDNDSLLIVSTEGIISKVSRPSGDTIWRFVHAEAKQQVSVEQLIPLDSIVLAFVRIDTFRYAEIFNSETGTLEWSCTICFSYPSRNQSLEETPKEYFQYQRWQLFEDNLAILSCYNRIYLYNFHSQRHSVFSYNEEPQLEMVELRLRHSPESFVPELCPVFSSKDDSLLSFSCIPFDDRHSRRGLSVMKTACESELYLLPTGHCVCKKQHNLIITEEQDPQSIENIVSFNQDFEILSTFSILEYIYIKLKENNTIFALKLTPEVIQVEELFHSQNSICCNLLQRKGCFITQQLSNSHSKIQYFELEPSKWTNYSWVIDSAYFHANMKTFVIPWNKLLCYYSRHEELVCMEWKEFETKLLWKKDLSMVHPVSYQLFTPVPTNCMTMFERSIVSFYQKNIQFLPRSFQLLFHKLLSGYYKSQNKSSPSLMCHSQGILVTISICGNIRAHLLDSFGEPSLLWKTNPLDAPYCLESNDSFKIFAMANDSILALWYHRGISSLRASTNLYNDCIYYLNVLDGTSLGKHCYYSNISLQVLWWDHFHLLLLYKNGTMEWDSYLQSLPFVKENFFLVAVDSNELTGYELDTQLCHAKYLYRIVLSTEERICVVKTADPRNMELQRRSVRFPNGSIVEKYPNLERTLLVITKKLFTNEISVYVVDGETGNILYYTHHWNASLPVSGLWSDNWFLYSLRNLATSSQEIYVGEMLLPISASPSYTSDMSSGRNFEAFEMPQNGSNRMECHFPLVYVQEYQVDIWVRDMIGTQTRKGITPKSILLHSLDGFLFAVPKLFFHPRRPTVQDNNISENSLQNLPYHPNIPLKPVHKQSEPLFLSPGVEHLISYPDRLRESCTLIVGLGLDWVVKLVAPVGQFDSLSEYFPRGQLTLILLFSVMCLYIVRKWSYDANIKARWLNYFQ